MNQMFDGAFKITSLNLSNWDISSMTTYSGIFNYAHADLAIICSDDVESILGKDCQ